VKEIGDTFVYFLEDRRPIFYTQNRVGKDRKIFNVYKSRSMIPDAEKHIGAVWVLFNCFLRKGKRHRWI